MVPSRVLMFIGALEMIFAVGAMLWHMAMHGVDGGWVFSLFVVLAMLFITTRILDEGVER